MAFPEPSQFQAAIAAAKAALNCSGLDANTVNVGIKYLLLQDITPGEIRYWRSRRQQPESLAALTERLQTALSALPNPAAAWGYADWLPCLHNYAPRLIELSMAAILSEALAPELCLAAQPAPVDSFTGQWIQLVVFAAPLFFNHEFYPLAVDAYVHNAEQLPSRPVALVAAHVDWLTTAGKPQRLIYLDAVNNRLVETELNEPLSPDSVQFLCLGKQEQALHAELASRFTCQQINPLPPAQLADDKAACLAVWAAAGLHIPAYQLLTSDQIAKVYAWSTAYPEWVSKPNRATEGLGVAYFSNIGEDHAGAIQLYLAGLAVNEEILIQQRRDGVCYQDPLTGHYHSLVLRLHVVDNGAGAYVVTSGYAQLGKDIQHPAACSQGGFILAIHQVLPQLCCRVTPAHAPLILTPADWQTLCILAINAASQLTGLLLVGLDVLLDIDQHGKLIPVLLEANPRPAGLQHARLLTADPYQLGAYGVGMMFMKG